MKKFLKILGILFLTLLLLPYLLPTEFDNEIPEKPFPNSVFFISSDKVSLHTQVYDSNQTYQGKILFIHGLGASTSSFRNNAPYFSEKGFDVISVDLPAFGYSSKESGIDHSQVNRARLIWEMLDKYDETNQSNDKWNLVGHSMGASTVLAMAEQHPERVNTINLVAGAVTSDQESSKWILYTPIGQWLKVALRYYLISDKQIASMLKSAAASTPSAEDVRYYIEPLKINGTINALVDFVKTSDNFLISEYTQKNIPINLFWGEKDTWVGVENIDIIKQYVEVNSVELLDEGHLVHETSALFNEKLLDKLINP